MSVKSPTESHVHYLASTADTKEGLAIRGSSVEHLEFNRSSLRLHVTDAGMCIARNMLESDLPPPREENTIHTGIERIPSVFSNKRRNQHRNASCLQNGISIGFVQNDTRLAVFIRPVMCGNSDDRFHGDIVNQKTLKDSYPLGSYLSL